LNGAEAGTNISISGGETPLGEMGDVTDSFLPYREGGSFASSSSSSAETVENRREPRRSDSLLPFVDVLLAGGRDVFPPARKALGRSDI
jgi:hypothetical protein